MSKFYLELWLSWSLRVIFCSLFFAFVFALMITLGIYAKQGFSSLDKQSISALLEIFKFWFFISLNLAVLLALFRSIKYIFNMPHAGYMFKLKQCSKDNSSEYIEIIGYGDLVKVWRKWFMLLIWLVGSLMILALIITYLFTSYTSLFDWFNIYILYFFILTSGYFSFSVLANRCKSVKIVKYPSKRNPNFQSFKTMPSTRRKDAGTTSSFKSF